MALPTRHLRFDPAGKLQQLFVFDDDDLWLLDQHALTDVDADVFTDSPGHSVQGWLDKKCRHEWRNVPCLS